MASPRIGHPSPAGEGDQVGGRDVPLAEDTTGERPIGGDVADVGAVLRRAREERAISLDEIAQTTKIRVAILRAIEANRQDLLPQTVFVRGLVQAYAREVGLDPDDTATRYLAQFEPAVDIAATSEPAATDAPQAVPAQEPVGRYDWRALSSRQIVVAIVLLVSLVGYGVGRWRARPVDTSRSEATEVERAASTGGGPAEVGTAGSFRSTAATPVDRSLHFVLRADRPCWVSATADRTRVIYRLMAPGEQDELDARDELVLRVGEPAAVALTINGVAGRPLGPPGQPVTVRITSENYSEYLRR